ncbi:MAG: PQQ-like beta-propeller repeat protein, partial [Deferribacterales bacterium]
VTSNILVYEGKVCAGTVDRDIACFTEEGEKLWEKEVDGIVGGLTVGDGLIFVTTENGVKLYALDITNGETKWIYNAGNMLSTPLYVKDMVVVTTSSGEILAIKDGKLLWSKQVYACGDVNSNSYIAASEKYIYASSMHKLNILDFKGNVVGEFEFPGNEEPGRPLVTKDMVIIPTKTSKKANVYLLWKGKAKLKEIKVLESGEVWMPSLSAAYGDIYVAVRVPDMIYRLGDNEKPIIGKIKAELSNETLKVQTTVKDERSGIYRVLLFYTKDSKWKQKDMTHSRRYTVEPVGGYGLNEEPYEVEVPIKDKIELYVVAIDNVGNYAISEVKAYTLTTQ